MLKPWAFQGDVSSSITSCCFYLRVRKVIDVAVVDFQQPVSILEAAARRRPSRHHIPDDVTRAPPLHPQTEAVGLPFLAPEEAESRAGGRQGVCKSQKIRHLAQTADVLTQA